MLASRSAESDIPPIPDRAGEKKAGRSIGLGALVLWLVFFGLYASTIDLTSPNVLWHNFVFDADLDRVASDAINGQVPMVFARHPLFLLLIAGPAHLVASLSLRVGPLAALRLVISAAAACGPAMAWIVFLRVVQNRLAALAFTCFYGLAATTWLLSSVPETFAVSASCIVACFALQSPAPLQPRRPAAQLAAFVLLSVVAIGTTVSSAVYVGLAYLASALRAQSSWRARARSLGAYGIAVAAAFAGVSWLQKSIFPAKIPRSTGLVAPWEAAGQDAFLRFDRPFSLGEALRLLRAFLLDTLIAPGCAVTVVDTDAGPNQMIQFTDFRGPTYLLALAAFGLFVVVTASRRSVASVAPSRDAPLLGLAGAYLGFNLLFHYFYRANGQPFIFSIHTVFPTLLILAHLYARSAARSRHALAAAALAAFALNNGVFLGAVRAALALPCAHRPQNVCVAWAEGGVNPRYEGGVDRYMASASYLQDLGWEALRQGRAEEAVRWYRAALCMSPGLVDAERDLQVAERLRAEELEARKEPPSPPLPPCPVPLSPLAP